MPNGDPAVAYDDSCLTRQLVNWEGGSGNHEGRLGGLALDYSYMGGPDTNTLGGMMQSMGRTSLNARGFGELQKELCLPA